MIPQMNLKRTIPLLLLGILFFIVYLYFFVGFSEVSTIFHQVDFFYYSMSFVALLVNMVFSSLTWYYFLGSLSIKVAFRKTYLLSWVGVFVDTLIPAESIGGDLSKAYLMTKISGEDSGRVLASVVTHRILSIAMTLCTLSISLVSLFIFRFELSLAALGLLLFVAIGLAISMIFILLLCFREQWTQRIIDLFIRFFNFILRGRLNQESLRSKAKRSLEDFHESFRLLKTQGLRILVQPTFYSIFSWFFTILSSYFVFVSLGYQVNFILITIVYSISCTIQNVPIGIPGETGLIEVIMTSFYALLGIPLAISAVATVLTRILWVWVRLPLGFISLQWILVKG